MIDHMV